MIVVRYHHDKCRASWGYYSKLCEPKQVEDMYILCGHCNWAEVLELQTCAYITTTDARCKRKPSMYSGFCTHHEFSRDAKLARRWYSIKENITEAQMAEMVQKYPSYVYIIAADGFIKIGHSKSPENRLKALQNEKNTTLRPSQINPKNMKIIKLVKGGQHLEQVLHGYCYKSHVVGEWFRHDSFVAQIIERLDDDWVKTVD